MDHGGMDHGGMDHGGHSMPDMPHEMPCKMAMVWNTDPVGHCLVFPSLQIGSQQTVIFWLLFIIAVSVLCEWLRLSLAAFDRQLRSNLRGGAASALTGIGRSASPSRAATPNGLRRPSGFGGTLQAEGSEEALLGAAGRAGSGRYWGVIRLPWFLQFRRSLGYAAHIALTFWIMLLVMSYNAQIIGAIILGAFLGHFIFQRHIDLGASFDDGELGKGLQCH
ncbi:hypothetical protein JCM10213_002102 [Rhodosporidiobolus nylandii]